MHPEPAPATPQNIYNTGPASDRTFPSNQDGLHSQQLRHGLDHGLGRGPDHGPDHGPGRGSGRPARPRPGEPASSSSSSQPRKSGTGPPPRPGQRIIDYENGRFGSGLQPSPALVALPATCFRHASREVAFRTGPSLNDCPNEVLVHIISRLHPDSIHTVALVSRRLHALVTSPHTWRFAFLRHFPGQDCLATTTGRYDDTPRAQIRAFGRLTAGADWRHEYLLRTRLLRGLAKSKAGNHPDKHSSSSPYVFSYGMILDWPVTNLDATFAGGASGSSGKRGPRVVHGASFTGITGASDPISGNFEPARGTSLLDPEEIASTLETENSLFGLVGGPTIGPNVMDISLHYGMVYGRGRPGGTLYLRPDGCRIGKYIGEISGTPNPNTPSIPAVLEGVSSVWIAKDAAVLAATGSAVGIVTGSSLGIVTTYSLVAPSPTRDITARWAVCPGVPIMGLAIDNKYSARRRSARRVWAVVLNALGEVYYLTEAPQAPKDAFGRDVWWDNASDEAWRAGHSVHWNLVELTRRRARMQERGSTQAADPALNPPPYPYRPSSLSEDQLAAEKIGIDRCLRYPPSYFRALYRGWDMRRKLQVDFAGDDGRGGGEAVLVIDCGHNTEQDLVQICRYTRAVMAPAVDQSQPVSGFLNSREGRGITRSVTHLMSVGLESLARSSTFSTSPSRARRAAGKAPFSTAPISVDSWTQAKLQIKDRFVKITACAIDLSVYACLIRAEEAAATATMPEAEMAGRRARLLGAGFDNGSILVWDIRGQATASTAPAGAEAPAVPELQPIRAIQTESPTITCLAVSALYLVHGGNDGLAQAWDPLASITGPVRTISAGSVRTSSDRPGAVLRRRPIAAIFIDPDPTSLRGVLATGSMLRSWSYGGGVGGDRSGHGRRHRRHHRRGELEHAPSRRAGSRFDDYIAAEQREAQREREISQREEARLRARFGVGFGDLTEEEAVGYAEMVSHETFLAEQGLHRMSPDGSSSRPDTAAGERSGGDMSPSDGAGPSSSSESTLSDLSTGGTGVENRDEDEEDPTEESINREFLLQIHRTIQLSLEEEAAYGEP